MGANTGIEWTDNTFNPVVGCTRVSPACDHCYAESWARRTGHPELWQGRRRRTSEANWRQPLKWNAQAKAAGTRTRVFCASLADVFDNQWEPQWRDDLWALIRQTAQLDWQLLTKRPQNIAKMLPADWGDGYHNVWLGTTVENQEEADRRIPHLLAVPAAVRFLSCEPLLGPVDLRCLHHDGVTNIDALRGRHGLTLAADCARLDWIVAGGESGPRARPLHPDWVRALRDQCAAAGVPFLFKQWGEFRPAEPHEPATIAVFPNGAWGRAGWVMNPGNPLGQQLARAGDHAPWDRLVRPGKKAAGRALDGVIHDGYPDGGRHG